MPQYIPEFTPADASDMAEGYLDAAEWLLDEKDRGHDIKGWSQEAFAEADADCADFHADNWLDIEEFCAITGRDLNSVGHDFLLTRNGHGAGFWDRGAGDVGDRLSKACKPYGNVDAYIGDDGYLYFD